MKPRLVQEPITGLRWIAKTPWEYALALLPTLLIVAAFCLGWFVGSRA